jgi:ABC-type sulfate transport system substrate-binding protein
MGHLPYIEIIVQTQPYNFIDFHPLLFNSAFEIDIEIFLIWSKHVDFLEFHELCSFEKRRGHVERLRTWVGLLDHLIHVFFTNCKGKGSARNTYLTE